MPTAEELVIAVRDEGIGDTKENLEGVEDSMEETAAQAGDSAEQLDGFAEKFQGAMGAAVAALAVAAGGLASQIPVVGELFSGLMAIMEAVGLQIDQLVRDFGVSGLTGALYDISAAILEADGAWGDLIGSLGAVGIVAGVALAALTALGVTLTGPILLGVAAVAAAVAGLALAWKTNFGNIQGITNETVSQIMGRFKSFVSEMEPIVNGFVNFWLGIWNAWGDEIMGVVNFAMRNLAAVVTSTIDIILSSFEFWAKLLTGDFSGAWKEITGLIGRLTKTWKPLVTDVIDVVLGAIIGFTEDVVEWIDNMVTDTTNAITGFVDKALEWGADLVEEFVKGVQSKVDWAAGEIEGAFNDITPNIQFDIRENDEMAQRWGSDMIEHFARGATQEASSVDIPLPVDGGSGMIRGSSGGGGGTTLDGRQLSESTGRYRADPARRRGL